MPARSLLPPALSNGRAGVAVILHPHAISSLLGRHIAHFVTGIGCRYKQQQYSYFLFAHPSTELHLCMPASTWTAGC